MPDDKRRHRCQMRSCEIKAVEGVVNTQPCSSWVFGPHSFSRMLAKDVTRDEVLSTLSTGYLIEINGNKDLCVVFRKEFSHSAVCVVAALRNRWIVTVWRNPLEDVHDTLDTSKYNWDVDARKLMAAFA